MSKSSRAVPTGTQPSQSTAPAYAWVVLVIAMLAGVAAVVNQFKVPPVMPVLMDRFNLDLSQAGMLMSIFAITGLVLALPAGMILQRLGPRASGLIALASLVLGASAGALSGQRAEILLASRLVEGIGMGLIAVVSPAVIVPWFPPERRGLPMGIWATWVSLGSLIIYNLAPALNSAAGWQAVWWAGAIFAMVIFILFALLVRPAPGAAPTADHPRQSFSGLRQALANRDIWLLALVFASFNFVVIGVVATYYPTFLKTEWGFSLADASLVTSLKMITVILAAPLAGWISDRIGSTRRLIQFSLIGLGVFMLFPFNARGLWIPVLMVVLGILAASLPTAMFAAAPAVMGGPRLGGLGLGVIMIGQNLGQLAGPVVFSALVKSAGWAEAGYWSLVMLVVGLAAIQLSKVR